MTGASIAKHFPAVKLSLLLLLVSPASAVPSPVAVKQQSLDEWRHLTSTNAGSPRVFVKGNTAHVYFETPTNQVGFSAHWNPLRLPLTGYRVHSARLRLDPKLSRNSMSEHGWHEAIVIAGEEWRQLTTNLLARLAPEPSGHGYYYQGLLADRLLYRDTQGQPQAAAVGQQPADVLVERHFSMDETLERVARLVEEQLTQNHPVDSRFLLLAPDAWRFPQPLLVDCQQRQCVWLAPAALYDRTDRGISLAVTAQGLRALFLESHGLALLKNPISSAARAGDLAVETAVKLLRLPFPKPGSQPPPLRHGPGMDLAEWETWLDRYTGTRRQVGALQLLIDGERFFPRLQQAIAAATNHIHVESYIFDKDDVAVHVADELKRRSGEVEVQVILDQMGSLASGTVPPATPLPENFVAPASITSYLRNNSQLQVRPFLNPWFSADHSKVFLVDGTHAWLGGMNLGREYRYEWHDLMVEVTGPVVASLEVEFQRAWAHEGPWGDLAYVAARLRGPKSTGAPAADPSASTLASQPGAIRLLPTKTGWKPFSAAVQGALGKAQNYIYVENPYLWDKRVISSLVRARNRGVDVRVVLPRVSDMKAGGRSNLVLANYFLEHGVRVYFYPGMTHVKALLADDWACLGSGNLNHLSLRLCQEQNLATSDPAFAAQLRCALFEEDFSHSHELTKPITIGWNDFLANFMLEGF